MRRFIHGMAFLLGVLLVAGCALRSAAGPACWPDFPLTGQWLGGDGVFSLPLPDGRVLWLFGDSFVADAPGGGRETAALIANSVGVSSCGPDGFDISYHWGRGGEGPAALFPDPAPGQRYWPLGAVAGRAPGSALVFLLRVELVRWGDPLGFRLVGVDLARIDDVGRPPGDWSPAITPVTAPEGVYPGAVPRWEADGAGIALVALVEGGAGPRKAIAGRLLPGDGPGAPALALAAGPPLAEGVPMELSRVRDAAGRDWIVTMDAAFPSREVLARAEGVPWGPPIRLARIPEEPEAGVFCYAGKAHEAFRRGREIAVTYVCNAVDPDRLMQDLTLYRPRVLGVRLPGEERGLGNRAQSPSLVTNQLLKPDR